LGGTALDELLAEQRLDADLAVGVGTERHKRASVDRQHQRRLVLRRERDRLDRADLDARDLDVLAGDHERGVVEHRPDEVAGLARAGRALDRHRRYEPDHDEHRDHDECPGEPHGVPPIVSEARQWAFDRLPLSTNGAE
jgi:hypothetical protein